LTGAVIGHVEKDFGLRVRGGLRNNGRGNSVSIADYAGSGLRWSDFRAGKL